MDYIFQETAHFQPEGERKLNIRKAPEAGHVRALVLAGGGAKGAYQIGAWKALKEIGYRYSIVTGTSVGALNAAMAAADRLDAAEEMWQRITTDMVLDIDLPENLTGKAADRAMLRDFLKEAVRERAIDQTPLKHLLEEVIPVSDIYKSPVDFGLVTVTYPSLHHRVFYKKDIPQDQFIDYLLASSACFPGMKPWRIGDQQYIDGGYYDNRPVQAAIDAGATEAVAIDCNGMGYARPYDRQRATVVTVFPTEKLGHMLLFDPETSKENIRRGYEDTLARFGFPVDGKR